MKIGINIFDLKPDANGGMAVYIKSVISFFPKLSPDDIFFLVGKKEVLKKINLNGFEKIEISGVTDRCFLSAKLKEIIRSNQIDVWFSPLLVLDPPFCPVPSATTIPDMQHEYLPEFFDAETLNWRKKSYQFSANNADLIFTLSQNSRNDIVRFLDINPNKVKNIFIDSSPNFKLSKSKDYVKKVKIKYHLPEKFLFFPANTWPHKNHLRLLKAFNLIKNQTDVNLVFSGFSHQSFKEILQFIRKNHLKKRVQFLGYVEEGDLFAIYISSMGLIFPSLFEGFGMPVIEAFRAKTPVLCSDLESLHEVAGDAALFFDPLSVSEMANSILKFTSNGELRDKLVKLGIARLKNFSYKKTAELTLKYLKQIGLKKKLIDQNSINYPTISVITPSYNQGQFIERTIKSVLNQGYPNLEYIVVDGGSTDNTIKILKKYSSKIRWISEKDKGQADAINKGIKMSSGEIIAYLNSDDTYEPGALKIVGSFFVENPMAKFVYGLGRHIDKHDKIIEDYPSVPTDFTGLHPTCAICQPTAFWRREMLLEIGFFDPSLKYAMDYDYWIRISKKYPLNFIYKYLGNTRFYDETKTVGQKVNVHREIIEVQKRYYDKVHANWILAYVHARLSKNNRSTIIKNTEFLLKLIVESFFGFIIFGHRLPPKRVFKYYLIWFKEIFAFAYRKKFKKLLKL
jgi:glycosyltransferase involved in cell wall biosynthesis